MLAGHESQDWQIYRPIGETSLDEGLISGRGDMEGHGRNVKKEREGASPAAGLPEMPSLPVRIFRDAAPMPSIIQERRYTRVGIRSRIACPRPFMLNRWFVIVRNWIGTLVGI